MDSFYGKNMKNHHRARGILRHFVRMVCFIMLLMMPTTGSAQYDDEKYTLDSLQELIKTESSDSLLARYYCYMAYATDNIDSCIKYAFKSLEHCKDTNSILIADNTEYIAWAYWMKGDARTGLPYLLKSTSIYERLNDTDQIAYNYRFLSNFYAKLNQNDSMTYCINKAMDINLQKHDTANIAQCYIELAEIYFDKNCYTESEKNLRYALELDSMTNNTLEYARCYYRLGELYCKKAENLDEYFMTKNYLKKAIKIFEDINSSHSVYVSSKHLAFGDLADIYVKIAKETRNDLYADSCLSYLKNSLDYLIENHDFTNAVAIGYTYFEYMKYYKRYKEGLDFLLRQKKYIKDETTILKLREYYDKLREAYYLVGDYKNAYECIVKSLEYHDASLNDSTMLVLATLKTEQAMIMENNERAHEEALHFVERRKLKITIILLCVVLVLICLLVFYVSRMLSIKRRNNTILMLKNETLNQQKSEIEAQRDEIESQKNEIELQKNIIMDQWHEVEAVNIKLIHSINYAQRIQRAALSKIEEVKELFPDSFVFYCPRDIVSGDFYRCLRCGKYAVMITADCTGHGIPGGFLSMLGLSGIKEFMVSEYDAENPGTVLDRMKDFIKSTLVSSQKGKIMDDGMDMTICCYDFENMVMHYAIAAQTAYIIRNGETIKLKGDAMPVGRYVRETDHFQSLTTPIQKGDMVYTFSDGIQDQPGGRDKRKFLQKNLVALLVSFADKPTDEQSQILEEKILAWRDTNPQIDDMTLIGIRV